jgi:ABC-2 type transport system permease protein
VIALVFQLHLKQIAVDYFVIFTVLIQPIIVALLAIYMLRDTDGFEPIFVVVGSGLTGLWSGTLFFSAFNIDFERWVGTLEEIVASPTPLSTVVTGKSLANTAMSLGSMVCGYTVAAAIFGFNLTVDNLPGFVVSLVLGVFAMLSIGLLLAPLMSINVGANVWVNALEFPMFIVGGFLFPIALLPRWTTPLSYVLAPYWAAQALHGTSSGGAPLQVTLFNWGMVLLLGTIYLALSQRLFKKLLFRARVEATLGLQ